MLIFECNVCRTSLSAEEAQAGQLVRCPKCMTALRVPATQPSAVVSGAPTGSAGAGLAAGRAIAPSGVATGGATSGGIPRPGTMTLGSPLRSSGRRFGFNCGYCSSRLEATEGMSGQEGQCPTCGNGIIIPILDRYGRLIDPMTGKIIKQDPHPVHAYAAAGERAPRILRSDDNHLSIMCPRCQSLSSISANNCKNCGMPFTMEGTTLEAAGTSNGFCVASLVLGIIGIPAFCAIIPSVLAIIFGIIGFNQVTKNGTEGNGKAMAIAGIACGAVGCAIIAIRWLA